MARDPLDEEVGCPREAADRLAEGDHTLLRLSSAMHRGWLSVNIAADWMPEAFVTSQSTALHMALHSSSKEQVTLAPQTLLIWRRVGSAAGNVGDQVGDAESFRASVLARIHDSMPPMQVELLLL